jgi:D-apionolactonase
MADSNRLIPLHTTAFEGLFETDTGFIRRIQIGNIEVIRAIYAAVRDHSWATILPVITATALKQERDGFLVRFSARCERGGISFWWEERLSAKGGELSCEFHGEAKSDFLRNRTGFCVLHPIRECAGKMARFTTPDGREHEGRFPDEIAPHQPFSS